jgi:hypothetical protein
VAPGGTTISEITYERYIGHMVDPDNFWSPALRVDGVIVPGETCLDSVQNGETCSIGGPPGQGAGPAGFTGLGAHELTLGVVCEATVEQECVTGATQHKVWAAMYGATVTIADSTAPTLNAPSGALWEGGGESGAVHSGTQSVAVSAYDDGGGVQSITLTADGQPVQRFLASCSFTFAQPCLPSTGPRMLTLVTNGLSNGPHTLGLVATDAAGNQSAVASEQITVAKSSPTGSPSSAPTSPVGTPASVSPPGGVIQQAILHLRAALRGRELVAYVKGPISGRVRVSFSGRRHGRTVAFGTQVRSLRHGALTALFRLGPRTAARALIRVSATLGHEQAVGSTLQRKRR